MLRSIFSISIIICAYIFYHWVSIDDNKPEEEFVESIPSYLAQSIKTTTYNKMGLAYRELSAQNVQYYEYLTTSYLTLPNVTYFPQLDPNKNTSKNISINQDELEMWTISADFGTVNIGDNIILRSNVLGHSTKRDAIITDIRTDYLEYDLNTQEIKTDKTISLFSNSLYNTCNSLSGNIQTQYFVLKDNCHATYKVTQHHNR